MTFASVVGNIAPEEVQPDFRVMSYYLRGSLFQLVLYRINCLVRLDRRPGLTSLSGRSIFKRAVLTRS